MIVQTQTYSFDQLPTAVAELTRKVDYLTSLLARRNEEPATEKDSPELLTVKQAAEFLNLAVPTMYGLVGRNEVPFMKRAKKLYFSRTELEQWIKQGRNKTTSELKAEVYADLKGKGQAA